MLEFESALPTLLQALADPARLAIVERLRLGPCSVGELAAPLPMTLAAVVQHVQVLEKSGVIATAKVGRSRMCHLSPEGLAPLESWLARHPASPAAAAPAAPAETALPLLRRARHHPRFRKASQHRP